MALNINGHLLEGDVNGTAVKQDPCHGKDSGQFTGDRPDTVIIHFTAGSTLGSAINTLKNPSVKASAHLVIDRDGSIVQLIGFDKIAWHAGKSKWQERTGLNKFSIGIELVNAGELKRSGSQYVSWFGHRYREDQVVEAVHRNQSKMSYWHAYTQDQIEACFDVCRVLKENYQIQFILGHEEIAPRRKTDPGPAFPLEKLRNQVLDTRDDEVDSSVPVVAKEEESPLMTARVTANRLNFRQQPYASAPLAGEPLSANTNVELLEKSGSWRKVRVYAEGWVHADYLQIKPD